MQSSVASVRNLASLYGQSTVGGRVDFRGDPSSLHGAAERNRFRNRSRDRAERASSTPQVTRSVPAGRMEGVEWMDALTSLTERVSTIERAQRAAAQQSATTTEQLNYLNSSLVKATDDIVEYKAYVEKVFSHIKPYVSSSVEEVNKIIQGPINDQFNIYSEKLALLQGSFDSLMAHVSNQPQRFNMTPPVPRSPVGSVSVQPIDPMTALDPWASSNAASATHAQVPRASAQQDLLDFGPSQSQPAPAMPGSFAPSGVHFQSPFDRPNEFETPPLRTVIVSPLDGNVTNHGATPAGLFQSQPPIGSTFMGAGVGAHGQPHHAGIGHVQTDHRVNSFEISYKPNEALRKFAGDSGAYKMWSSRMKDHMARANPQWKVLLNALEVCDKPITKNWLVTQWSQGSNAWELANKLETFISTWVNDTLYSRRVQMAGGKSEEGNGFEIWRQLFLEHHGGAHAVQLGGMRRLQEWPRCTSIANLSQHLDSWVECLETHNTELLAAPTVLRNMVLSIIPSDFEDEVLVRPEISSYRDIISFCKVRITYKRQKQLAELARRPNSGGRINQLVGGDDGASADGDKEEAIPTWANMIINSLNKLQVPPPPAPHQARRPTKDADESEVQALRQPAANGRKAFNMKFKFVGCWHCGQEGHSRKANPARNILGCPKFEALKKRNGDKPPAGYKGAYEKARDAAWEKFKASSSKKKESISRLDDTEDEDDDSDIDLDDMFALRTAAPQSKSYAHRNSFADLSDGDESEEDLDDSIMESFANFAHKVKMAPAKKLKKKKGSIKIASLKDLDLQIASNPQAFKSESLNSKRLQRSLRRTPMDIQLDDDEILALIDTGSSIHAADADIHFPEYSKLVRKPASQKSPKATTAGGHKLANLGKFVVSAETNGQQVSIPFNHMKVQLPILSVRQMMRKGGQMVLTDSGGSITNPLTRQTIDFVIHDNLWYAKLKVNKPPPSDAMDVDSDFVRQGSA